MSKQVLCCQLNMEQLRKMDGKAVRVVYDEAVKETTPGFEPLTMIALVEVQREIVLLTNNIGGRDKFRFDEDLTNEGITVYDYQPAYIDREAWTAEWVKHDGYTECSKCEHWYDSPDSEDDGDRPAFCPACGRAMTQAAWAKLEKRWRRCME